MKNMEIVKMPTNKLIIANYADNDTRISFVVDDYELKLQLSPNLVGFQFTYKDELCEGKIVQDSINVTRVSKNTVNHIISVAGIIATYYYKGYEEAHKEFVTYFYEVVS